MGFLGVICCDDPLIESQNAFSFSKPRPSFRLDFDQRTYHQNEPLDLDMRLGLRTHAHDETHLINST